MIVHIPLDQNSTKQTVLARTTLLEVLLLQLRTYDYVSEAIGQTPKYGPRDKKKLDHDTQQWLNGTSATLHRGVQVLWQRYHRVLGKSIGVPWVIREHSTAPGTSCGLGVPLPTRYPVEFLDLENQNLLYTRWSASDDVRGCMSCGFGWVVFLQFKFRSFAMLF
jgi:hypothetical protein